MVDHVVDEADDRVDAADDGADLGDEGGEGLRLLAHHHHHGRDVVVEDGVGDECGVDVRVRLAFEPLELARAVLVVIGLVKVGV